MRGTLNILIPSLFARCVILHTTVCNHT